MTETPAHPAPARRTLGRDEGGRRQRARRAARDLWAVGALAVGGGAVAVAIDLTEQWHRHSRPFESWQVDELAGTLAGLLLGLGWWAWRRWREAARAEHNWEAARTRLSDILDAAPSVIYRCELTNEAGEYRATPTFVSDRVRDVLGYEPEECLEDPSWWPRVLHPDDAPRASSAINHLIERGRHVHQYRVRAKDGRFRWIRDELVLGRDRTGAPAHFVGSWSDVTTEKELEREAASSEERFRFLFEQAPDAIFLHDLEGRFVDGNPAAERLLGTSKSELIGRSFLELPLVPDPVKPEVARFLAASAAGQEVGPVRLPLKRSDGETLQVEVRSHPVRLHDRDLVLGIARDVGEREQLLEELSRSRESFEGIVARNDNGLLVTGPDGIVLYANPAAGRLLQRPLEEISGQPFEPLPPRGGTTDLEILPPEGGSTIVEVQTAPTRWGGGDAILVTLNDVTERRKAAETLAKARQMEWLRGLAGGLAHELNNVLQALQTGLDLVGLEDGEAEERGTLVPELRARVRQAAGIARQLLLFAGEQTPRREPLDINLLLAETTELLGYLVPVDVALRVEPAAGPLPVEGDAGQLQHALLTLVQTAAEALSEGSITVRAGESPEGVWLSVADTGPGLDEEILQRIFEASLSLLAPSVTRGLGLPVVRSIAETHGGTVDVESAPGRGTTFRLTLPRDSREPRRPEPAPTKPGPEARAATGGGHPRILLVEDSGAVRRLLTRALGGRPYEIVAVASAEQALEREDEAFDLLLSDILLPGASGIDLARRLRHRRPLLPVLLLSAYAKDEVELGKGLDGARFLQKPMPLARLVAEIDALLARGAEGREGGA